VREKSTFIQQLSVSSNILKMKASPFGGNQVAAPETDSASETTPAAPSASTVSSAPSVSHTITMNEILTIVWVLGIALFI